MKIYGIGTDLTEVKRIENLLNQYAMRFVKRILSSDEIMQFKNSSSPAHYLSKRFAAKEAVSKSLGTGIGQHMAFNEISILNHATGQPFVAFIGNAKATVEKLGIQEVMISLSDENAYSLAFAVAVLI